MKKHIFLAISIFLITLNCKSQSTINEDLKKQLEQIVFTDQIYREFIDNNTSQERREEIAKLTNNTTENLYQNVFKIIEQNDKTNFEKVEKIVEKYGYPGKSLVGEPANTAVFYVIQHNPDKISKYYPIIEKAGKSGELPFTYVAMMLDRKLTGEQKPQIYGTQLGMRIINKDGKQENFVYVLPIEDAKNVNLRRKKAGFETTVEENARKFGVEYKEFTYDELEKIK